MRPKTNRLLMLLIGAMLAGCASQTERSSSGGGAEQAQAPAPKPAPAPAPKPAYEPQSESVQFVDRPLEETPPPPPAPVAKAPEQPLPDFPVTKYEVEPEEVDSMADEPEEELGVLGTQPDESDTMQEPEVDLAAMDSVVDEPTQVADEPVARAPVRVSFEAEPLFSFDKSVVRSDQRSKLDEFVASLKGTQYDSIDVIGHADHIGSEKYNLNLSQRRANAVKTYLVRQGIPTGKINAEGRGESEPVTAGTCRAQRGKALIACLEPDRRVDVSVTATKPAN